MSWREKAAKYFESLQVEISRAVEDLDGSRFREDPWLREGGGGGRTRILERGSVLDRKSTRLNSSH